MRQGIIGEAWQNATLVNSWANITGTGLSVTKYRKITGNIVEVRGAIYKGTAKSAGETIFTMPTGFRPIDNLVVSVRGGAAHTSVAINSTGTFTWLGGGDDLFFQMIFSTD